MASMGIGRRRLVANTKMFPFPDYDLDLIEGQSGPLLRMRYREEGATPPIAEPGQLALAS